MPPRSGSAPKDDPRFHEIARERVSDRVAQELLQLIATGELAPGERLPGERQLAEMMHVSRVSVRAALQDLKTQGVVSAIQGGGTRVLAKAEEIDSGLARLVRASAGNLHDLAEIRATLEVWAARRAARCATPEQREAIARALAVMSEPDRPARFKAEDDFRFHLAIAKASGSAVYLHLMTVLGGIFEKMLAHHRYTLYATLEDDRRFLQHHQAIAEAICAGDPEAAALAMQAHVTSVLRRYGETAAGGGAPAVAGADLPAE